jgi:hypothetical protein
MADMPLSETTKVSSVPDRTAVLERAATLLAHDENLPFDPVVPPIYQSSLFTFRSYQEMEDAFAGRISRPIYSRGDNPTVMEFERRVAALEGTEAIWRARARMFSSCRNCLGLRLWLGPTESLQQSIIPGRPRYFSSPRDTALISCCIPHRNTSEGIRIRSPVSWPAAPSLSGG